MLNIFITNIVISGRGNVNNISDMVTNTKPQSDSFNNIEKQIQMFTVFFNGLGKDEDIIHVDNIKKLLNGLTISFVIFWNSLGAFFFF